MMLNTPRLIWWFLAAGLALRMLVIQWTSGIELILDEVNYMDYGSHLLAHGVLPDAFRPPLYPTMIALSHWMGGATATSVRITQALIATGAGMVLYRWLAGHVGHRGAALTCGLWCFYPVLIGYTHLLWTETVFLSMLIFFLATALPAGSMSHRRTYNPCVVF